MKTAFFLLSVLSSTSFAQTGPSNGFTRNGFPTKGLTLNCRTAADVVPASISGDGRLFVHATIMDNNSLQKVRFKINQASFFTKAYHSKVKDLKIINIQMGGRTVRMLDSYSDEDFSFSIDQLPNFNDWTTRKNTFSANVGIVEKPLNGGLAKNYDLLCSLTEREI